MRKLVSFVAAALIAATSLLSPPANAQEVPNGSSELFDGWSKHELNSRPEGYYVPPVEELRSAFGCINPTPEPNAKKTVILVPGIGVDERHSFLWNYFPQLNKQDFDVCWVKPKNNGRADATQSALYVAESIRLASQRLGKYVAVVGHSAGPPVALWALRYDHEFDTVVLMEGLPFGKGEK